MGICSMEASSKGLATESVKKAATNGLDGAMIGKKSGKRQISKLAKEQIP